MYLDGSRIHRVQFLIIKETLAFLLGADDCLERTLLERLLANMNHIVRINRHSVS